MVGDGKGEWRPSLVHMTRGYAMPCSSIQASPLRRRKVSLGDGSYCNVESNLPSWQELLYRAGEASGTGVSLGLKFTTKSEQLEFHLQVGWLVWY